MSTDVLSLIPTANGDCQAAFAELGKANAECLRIATFMANHPHLSVGIESMLQHGYKTAHDGALATTAAGAIDWTNIIQWVITNGPAIMQFIMQIVAMFG